MEETASLEEQPKKIKENFKDNSINSANGCGILTGIVKMHQGSSD